MNKTFIRYSDSPLSLENAVREAILKREYDNALVVLEGLYKLKIDSESWLTFAEIKRLLRDNFGMSYQLIYQGLQTKLIFQRRKSAGVAYRLGARPYLYRVPSPVELKVEFAPDSRPTPSDKLMRTDLKSVHTYKLALHREFMTRLWIASGGKGVVMFRDYQAERINVSTRTIRSYDKQLGFSHEANYIKREITIDNWNKLPRYKTRYDENGKRVASRKFLHIVDNETGKVEVLPYVRYLAYINLKADKAVYEVERTANTYYPYQLPEKRNLRDYDYDVAQHYYAHQSARESAGFFQDSNGNWYKKHNEWQPEPKTGYFQNSDEQWYYARE